MNFSVFTTALIEVKTTNRVDMTLKRKFSHCSEKFETLKQILWDCKPRGY